MLVCAAVWRAVLAGQHYLASSRILDDPSARELEEVSALFECALAVFLLGHAVLAASYTRRPFGLNAAVVASLAVVAGATLWGSLQQLPVLSVPGLTPASLLVAGGFAGYLATHAAASAYLGVVLGSFASCVLALPESGPFVLLAVTVPPVVFALVGVGLGRLARRHAGSRPVA